MCHFKKPFALRLTVKGLCVFYQWGPAKEGCLRGLVLLYISLPNSTRFSSEIGCMTGLFFMDESQPERECTIEHGQLRFL